MKKSALLFLCVLGAFLEAKGGQGMEFTLSKPYAETAEPRRFILALSWFNGRVSPFPGFDEYGVTAMLPWGNEPGSQDGPERTTDFVGLYAGHLFLPFQGRIRPGFDLGWVWEGVQKPASAHPSRQFALYYAMKVQVSCLTFVLSSKGIGGGINLSL